MSSEQKVLIVEDEAFLREIIAEELREAGFIALEAQDGEDGLQQAGLHLPDLILLDILMPRMDGCTMLKKLREQESTKRIPVIILTNFSNSQSIVEAFDFGIPPHTQNEYSLTKEGAQNMQEYVNARLEHGIEGFFVKSTIKLNYLLQMVKKTIHPSRSLLMSKS